MADNPTMIYTWVKAESALMCQWCSNREVPLTHSQAVAAYLFLLRILVVSVPILCTAR